MATSAAKEIKKQEILVRFSIISYKTRLRVHKILILQIVSPSEDVKFCNVRGLYLRKYGSLLEYFLGNLQMLQHFLT